MKKVLSIVLMLALLGVSTVAFAGENTNNYAYLAQAYLEYIGGHLQDRNITAIGEEVSEDNRHQATMDWIVGVLKDVGYDEAQIEVTSDEAESWNGEKTYPVQNIVLSIEGRQTDRQVIVGAHYDGDGVGDNGSGIALRLATAVGLYGQQPLYNAKLVFFDGEEYGLFGSRAYVASMTEEEIASTLYMVNMDALAFGDYCNLYGGTQNEDGTVTDTEAYELALAKADALGINVMDTEALDGYYAENGEGPKISALTVYTNPWTLANPAPLNADYVSPATGDWSDHAPFKNAGIPYIYFEATNWYAEGDGGEDAYTGYFETSNPEIGEYGMFMNTEHDTWANLNEYFPNRSVDHFTIFSPILSSLILNPADAEPFPAEAAE